MEADNSSAVIPSTEVESPSIEADNSSADILTETDSSSADILVESEIYNCTTVLLKQQQLMIYVRKDFT